MPAFEAGIKEQQGEIDAIVNNTETPTFENTILPFDKSGQTLDRVSNVFFNLNECLTNDEMIAIAEQVLPMLSKHSDAIMMNPKLFERIDYVYQHRNEMDLDDQQIRVVEKYHPLLPFSIKRISGKCACMKATESSVEALSATTTSAKAGSQLAITVGRKRSKNVFPL